MGKYQKNSSEYWKSNRIWASTKRMIESGKILEKGSNLGKYHRKVQASTGRVMNLGKYQRREWGEYRKSDRIWACTRRIQASTEKVIEYGIVLEKGSNLGKYQQRVRVSIGRVIESGQVPKEFG